MGSVLAMSVPLFLLLLHFRCCSFAHFGRYSDCFARHKMYPFVSLPNHFDPHKCLSACFGSDYEFGGRVSASANLGKCCDGWGGNCALEEETACTVFSALREKAIYVVFQGTISLQQLRHEFESFNLMVQLPLSSGGGRVSLYYWNAFQRLWKAGLAVQLSKFVRRHPNFELRLIGHSMGGAIAALAASFLAHDNLMVEGQQFSRRIRLYTFGAVHSGDRRWALDLKRFVPDSFRVTNHWDIVPQIARSILSNYYHHGTEVDKWATIHFLMFKNVMTANQHYVQLLSILCYGIGLIIYFTLALLC